MKSIPKAQAGDVGVLFCRSYQQNVVEGGMHEVMACEAHEQPKFWSKNDEAYDGAPGVPLKLLRARKKKHTTARS